MLQHGQYRPWQRVTKATSQSQHGCMQCAPGWDYVLSLEVTVLPRQHGKVVSMNMGKAGWNFTSRLAAIYHRNRLCLI